MRILIGDTLTGTPAEIKAFAAKLSTVSGANQVSQSKPSPYLSGEVGPGTADLESTFRTATDDGTLEFKLDKWSIQAHVYRDAGAATAGFLAGLFSGSAEGVRAGVVHEAKRYTERELPSGHTVEFGTAVRLSVATVTFESNFDLTLPNLAADAQLNASRTRIGITVEGYSGAIGSLLPAPMNLDVETCANYLQAFKDIQDKVFGEQGLAGISPTLLSYSSPTETTGS